LTYAEALKEFKITYWRELLIQKGGNLTEAAKIAGIYRQIISTSLCGAPEEKIQSGETCEGTGAQLIDPPTSTMIA
jgi:hypothetical protein